jgi:membrane protein DedA with SNARE-associated domain
MLVIPVLLFLMVAMAAVGFLIGYFVGRSSGRRETQQGFPVLPAGDPHDRP